MRQQLTIRIKDIYTKLFPLDSFRRFIADELLRALYVLTYYGIGISTSAAAISTLLYVIGSTIEMYIVPVITEYPYSIFGSIVTGFASIIILTIIVMSLALTHHIIYDCDYVYWLEDQKSQLLDVEEYSESGVIERYLPMGSLRKYLLLRSIYLVLLSLCLIVYAILSVYSFKLLFGTPHQIWCDKSLTSPTTAPCVKTYMPDTIILLISVWIQMIFTVVGLLVYSMFNRYCRDAYAKHLQRAETSVSKRY